MASARANTSAMRAAGTTTAAAAISGDVVAGRYGRLPEANGNLTGRLVDTARACGGGAARIDRIVEPHRPFDIAHRPVDNGTGNAATPGGTRENPAPRRRVETAALLDPL